MLVIADRSIAPQITADH